MRDCTESWIACELKLYVILRYFHLYDIQIAGFLAEAFPRVFFCVSCVIEFSSLLYVLCLILLKID